MMYIAIWILGILGYLQHLVTTWANDQLMLFILGLIVFPIGVLHGWLIWLGIAG